MSSQKPSQRKNPCGKAASAYASYNEDGKQDVLPPSDGEERRVPVLPCQSLALERFSKRKARKAAGISKTPAKALMKDQRVFMRQNKIFRSHDEPLPASLRPALMMLPLYPNACRDGENDKEAAKFCQEEQDNTCSSFCRFRDIALYTVSMRYIETTFHADDAMMHGERDRCFMTNNKNYEILSIEENARTGGVCAEVRKDGAKYYFDLSNALTMQGFGPECMAFDIKPNGKPDFAWEKAVWYPPEISEAELLKCIEEFFEE